jgi:RHS repeat-associated protein
MDFTYGFNYGAADNGNVQSVANNITTARSQSYTYDELNRVSTAKTSATSGTYSWGLQFGYDPWANLLSASVTQGSAYSFSVYSDVSNRIHNTGGTFTYDAAGNLTADPVNSSYTYNAEGELTSAAGVTYTYDAEDRRVMKSTGKTYWYGVGSDPLSESDVYGNISNEYIFLNGARIAMLTLSTGAVNYYIADHLSSSRIVANSSGSVLDDSDFYPYGGERSYSSSSGNNYKFTGKERDTESGLDDFAARFYTSNYGRFLSADESKYAKPADPQTWNLYTYVANNPVNAVDPTGHEPDASLAWAEHRYKPMQHGGSLDDSAGNVDGDGADSGPSDSNSGTGDANGTATGSDTKTYLYAVTDGDNTFPEAVQATNSNDAYAAVMSSSGPSDPGEGSEAQPPEEYAWVVVKQTRAEQPWGHISIGINGRDYMGLEPDSKAEAAKAFAQEATDGIPRPVPGHVEADHAKGTDSVTLRVTMQQASQMQAFISQASQQPQAYDFYYRNCATFVEQTLRSGGMVGIPNDMTPGGLMGDLKKLPH